MALLELNHVSRRFGDFTAVDDVSFGIEAGEFFTLLGPSGCGKTTILRMIAGFEDPDDGVILLDGQPLAGIPPERRPVHTVFQSYALFPHMTVAGNIAFPLEMVGCARDEIRRRVAEALALVHLSDKGGHYPHELSGGQKQRVALARALINRPRLLLLDESLSALDAKLREEMQIELIALQREVGISFIFVTHAQQEALALSHRIAVMNQGRVVQIDEPSRLYGFPRNRFVADFIGKINLLPVTVSEAAHGHLRLGVPGLGEIVAPPAEGAVTGTAGFLALRPEQVRVVGHLETAELKNRFSGRVRELLYLGDVTHYMVALDGGTDAGRSPMEPLSPTKWGRGVGERGRFPARWTVESPSPPAPLPQVGEGRLMRSPCGTDGIVVEAMMPNAAPGRARFHEVGDAVAVCWRHDAGIFLRE